MNDVVRTGGRWVRPQVIRIPPLFGDEPYLTRYVLFRTPWFGIYVHAIHSPDGDRDPHNHPRQFWSCVLRGGYTEHVTTDGIKGYPRAHRAGTIHKMHLAMFHGIASLSRRPTWTLLVVGRIRQEWGFMTTAGFVLADDYKRFIEESRA